MAPSKKRQKSSSFLYSPYEIPFNPNPLRTPRKLRIICIGAGFAGLTLAYKINIERRLGHVIDFQIYERQHDVGGTWLANKYPGLTCDVPIHIYTLPWAPKHDWTRFMASGHEIIQYIRDVSREFQLDRWIKFNSSVEEALWDEDAGKWKLRSVWTIQCAKVSMLRAADSHDRGWTS
jgi:cation diffusion facilitator CzcD-associated flavoprotein CzcO